MTRNRSFDVCWWLLVLCGCQSTQALFLSSSRKTTTTSTTTSQPSALPHNTGYSVTIIEPHSKCQIELVGCLHGSPTSAANVQQAILSSPQTDGVLLELCASRFLDMQRQPSNETNPTTQSIWNTLTKTRKQKGWSTAVATAVLGTVSTLQTGLGGLTPGLEFSTATKIAVEQELDVILIDQNVDSTLQKIGRLPQSALQMLHHPQQYATEARALHTAVWGSSTNQETNDDDNNTIPSLRLLSFLTRSPDAVADLVRSLLVPTAIVVLSSSLLGTDATTATTASATTTITDSLWLVFGNALFLGALYIFLALPACGVILRERDEIMARNIVQACAHNHRSRVVVVLGLLHVNGVAERIVCGSRNKNGFGGD